MYIGVFLHVRLLVEPLAAVLAGIRPGIRVDEQVCGKRTRPFKTLAALLALEENL